MQGLLEPKGKLMEAFGSENTERSVNELCQTIRLLLESISQEKQANPKFFNGKYSKQRREDALQVSANLIKDKQYKQVYVHTSKGSKNVWHLAYNPKDAFLTRLRIFEEIVNLYALRSAQNPAKQGAHWIEWAYSDAELRPVIQQYQELEQARFVNSFGDRIYPELLDQFIAVIDSIFDLRMPPLLTVLAQYPK